MPLMESYREVFTLHIPLCSIFLNALAGVEPLVDISTEVLRAELLKRVGEDYDKPECGSNGVRGSYNTSLHVAALILILVLSTAGGCLALSVDSRC